MGINSAAVCKEKEEEEGCYRHRRREEGQRASK